MKQKHFNILVFIPENDSEIELAFFGGNFTGLQFSEQEAFLKMEKMYEEGKYQQVKFYSNQGLTGREYKSRLFVSFL